MEIIHSALLGAVQGLTEFLPISSSGHLVLLPWFFEWPDLGLTFDVALHVGTLMALTVYFWKDWVEIIRKWKEPMLWLILIGCVPAAVFGYQFEHYFETVFRSPFLVGTFMIAMGLLMGIAEAVTAKNRDISSLRLRDALFIGCAQVLALMPGVSRSGITMTSGLFTGLKRESAARFSFLLAMPITAGAALLKLKHVATEGLPPAEQPLFLVGILFSGIVGYFAIKYLLKFLERHTLHAFVGYRLLLGSAAILLYFFR